MATVVCKDRPAACLRSMHLSGLRSMNYAERVRLRNKLVLDDFLAPLPVDVDQPN